MTLKHFPDFNASLDASGENLVLKKYIHIGVAVDTPDGLMVPVIRDVDQKGIVQLAKELGEISAKAREKKITAADMQDYDPNELLIVTTGSQVSPRLCSMPISAAFSTCRGLPPSTAASAPAAIEQATPTSP